MDAHIVRTYGMEARKTGFILDSGYMLLRVGDIVYYVRDGWETVKQLTRATFDSKGFLWPKEKTPIQFVHVRQLSTGAAVYGTAFGSNHQAVPATTQVETDSGLDDSTVELAADTFRAAAALGRMAFSSDDATPPAGNRVVDNDVCLRPSDGDGDSDKVKAGCYIPPATGGGGFFGNGDSDPTPTNTDTGYSGGGDSSPASSD